MKFTVVESKWLRGGCNPEGRGVSSMLENQNGEKCCMGFLAEACGVPRDARGCAAYFSSNRIEPFDNLLPEALRPRSEDTTFGYTKRAHGELAQRIYRVNDDHHLSNAARKQRLTTLFAEAGVVVEFVP